MVKRKGEKLLLLMMQKKQKKQGRAPGSAPAREKKVEPKNS